jgi:predicted membrane-bound mannosyltransferase
MIRLIIFLIGLVALLVGAASHGQWIPLPFDCRSIVCSIGSAGFSLDIVLMIAGVFLILIAWLFHRLAQ